MGEPHCAECGAKYARDGYAAHRPLCSRYTPGCLYDLDRGGRYAAHAEWHPPTPATPAPDATEARGDG